MVDHSLFTHGPRHLQGHGNPKTVSRPNCISNRNTRIIAEYVTSKLGHHDILFDGLPYPSDRYGSPEHFFLNEDEWTTYDNFQQILRRGKDLVGEAYFYFNCGASTASLRSWGRLDYFARIFRSPDDGFRKLPFFNKNFDDTKEIEIILPPSYDISLGKMRVILKVQFHRDVDPNRDYIGDPYTRGIISSIPTIWGLPPAMVKQPVNPYDPEILFNTEPEFIPFHLQARVEGDFLTIVHPQEGRMKVVGRKITLEPETINGQEVFLGKYRDFTENLPGDAKGTAQALLITDTVEVEGRILLKEGEIFKAPYFILDVTYDRFSIFNRLSQVVKIRRDQEGPTMGLIETINQLRETVEAKNQAYLKLERANAELKKAKSRLDEYARNLEQKVEERTAQLLEAREELLKLNRDLESKVKTQVVQLERYRTLRRYLSPKLAERIISTGDSFGEKPKRKMMTVVFSDIRGFSSITDSLESEELFQLLDRYLSEMIQIVYQHDGTLNKILGDGLVIFFGDPIAMDNHAEKAVRMAIAMQRKAGELKVEWRQYGHELGIGIGINTGFMTVGNIGSEIHRDYTVIGNQVNVSARLESISEPGQILISQRTYSQVKHLVGVREVGEIRVKGIHSPIKTYSVIW